VSLEFSVQLFSVIYFFELTRQIDHLHLLAGSGNWATMSRLRLALHIVMSSANDFSIFASDDTNFMGGLLSMVNWQVAEEHNLKHKGNVDGTLVSDLKLVENLWRA
jgi:hypothetical protein